MRAILMPILFAAMPAMAEVGQTEPDPCKPFAPTEIAWSQHEDGHFTGCTVLVKGLADDRQPAWLHFQGSGAVPVYPWWFGRVGTRSKTRCPASLEEFETYALYVLNGSDERHCRQGDAAPCPPANPYQRWVTNRLEAACGRCDAAQAPNPVTVVPQGASFFYVDLRLHSGTVARIGFEHDGERWEHAEQTGDASGCARQLQAFVDYTLAILTAEECASAPAYAPEQEALLSSYVHQVENFCRNNR